MGAALQERRPAPRRRPLIAERLAGFVYGTIVVLAVLVAGVRAYPDDAGRIAVLVLVTSFVLWVAHVWHALAHSVAHDERVSPAELRLIARREGSLVEAAVPLLAALMLGAFDAVSTSTRSGSRSGRARGARCSGHRVRPGRAAALAGDASGRRGERRPRSRPGRPQAVPDPPDQSRARRSQEPQAAPSPAALDRRPVPPTIRKRADRRAGGEVSDRHCCTATDRHDHELLEAEVEGTHRQHAGHQAPAGHGRSPVSAPTGVVGLLPRRRTAWHHRSSPNRQDRHKDQRPRCMISTPWRPSSNGRAECGIRLRARTIRRQCRRPNSAPDPTARRHDRHVSIGAMSERADLRHGDDAIPLAEAKLAPPRLRSGSSRGRGSRWHSTPDEACR